MKLTRLAAMGLAGVMTLGTGINVCAAAPANISTLPGSSEHDVKAVYEATTAADTVYSVDVAWGSMEFTYTVADEGTWNPLTHQYDGALAGTWSSLDGADEVTVTNHSNAPVLAGFTYVAEQSYNTITGTFDKTAEQLATAEGTDFNDAPNVTAQLTLTGALNKSVAASTQIGTATVTLSDVTE